MKIKSFIYTLLSIVTALLFTGCSDEDIQSPNKDEKMVTWTISVTLPEAQSPDTRAFNRTDFKFEDLHVAVFSEAGGVYFLEQFVKADNTVPTWNSTNNCWDFGVTLMETTTPRRLHIIANYPGLTMGFGEESQLIGRLLTDAGTPQHDVYWNYVDVTKIAERFETQVQRVPLVRNFAQLKLSTKEPKEGVDLSSKFQVAGFAIYNVPTRGTVAPYNSKNGTFANYVVNAGGTTKCETYGNLFNSGYEGNEPYDDGTLLSKTITDDDFIDKDRSHYIYERSNRNTTSPTSMIIKAKYAPDGSFGAADYTYYKLDFVYVDSETNTNVYYNILRNFIYTINIKDVTGEGYATIQEAIEKPASNNVSGDVSLKDYTNVSDGKSRLFVSSTYLVFTNDSPIDLYYQHRPDIETSPNGINNSHGTGGHVTINAPAGDVLLQSATVAANDEPTGSNHAGWRKITLTPKSPEAGSVYRQDITVATRDLQRQITLVLRTPYNLGVEVDEYVLSEQGAPLDVKITIPGGMPSSLFPLRLFISTDKNTIDPQPGTQMPAEAMNGKYGFIKEISYMYYSTATANGDGCNVAKKEANGDVSFVTFFRSNCAASAATVQVSNQYFNTGSDSFINTDKYTTLALHKNLGVNIQRTLGRLPQRIYDNGSNNGIIYNVNVFLDGVNTGKTITIDKSSVLTEMIFENANGLDLNSVVTFTFEDKYYTGNNNWSAGTVEYTATCTLKDIKKRAILNFKAPAIPLYEIEVPTNMNVTVQRVYGRYPQNIYNDGNNAGTENVTVTLDDNNVGEIKISNNKVIEGSTLVYTGIFDLDDELTFTFTDKYWYGTEWKSDVTYTATATVREIQNGTTLTFIPGEVDRLKSLTITKESFASVSVPYEQSSSYYIYPKSLHNSNSRTPKTDGTETVYVYYKNNNTPVGEITIEGTSLGGTNNRQLNINVTDVKNTSITIEDQGGIDITQLRFEFKDNPYSSYSYGTLYFGNETTYTATTTIEALMDGTAELNFTRQ